MTAQELPPREGSGAMFDSIAARYDLLNRIISLGIDRRWRHKTVQALQLEPGAQVVDLATGTADLAIQIARSCPGSAVVGVDPSPGMLAVGRDKVTRLGLEQRVRLMLGQAEVLPFPDNRFDGTTIAFGIRNVVGRGEALREMSRITRPGGRIAILELSEPRSGWLAPLARFHVHKVVPWVGGLLSGSREYRYLQRSIAAFPSARAFGEQMEAAGLEVIHIESLTFGVAHLFVAKPRSAG